MAKRKDLTEKLVQPSGWIDQIEQPSDSDPAQEEPAKAGDHRRKTYLLTDDLIDRIEAMADREHVGINELVRWLLDDSLTRIEDGTNTLPTAPVQRRTLGK